jgi:hypothetical protein
MDFLSLKNILSVRNICVSLKYVTQYEKLMLKMLKKGSKIKTKKTLI